MSWAAKSIILIRVDARAGQWVPIEDLAAHMAVGTKLLEPVADELGALGLVELQRAAEGRITHVRAAMQTLPQAQ
jgi:hypothetical protein